MQLSENSNAQGEPRSTTIPLYPSWRLVFDKYDTNGDGKISFQELKAAIKSENYAHDIPENVEVKILKFADTNKDGVLDYDEFEKMIQHKEIRGFFAKSLNEYVHFLVPSRKLRREDTVDGSGIYEEEYTCYPPPIMMLVISIVEIISFLWDIIDGNTVRADGPAAKIFIYNPFKRYEAWRYFTYMFVHVGIFHLIVNLIVQVVLGIPLEMVHGWWRVLIVYLSGVIAGSLGTSVSDPKVYLAGASGGVYALMTAHVATIIMNWSEMRFPILQLLVFIILAVVDTGTAIYDRYVSSKDNQIGYAAHLAGAIAGLLIGINVLRNLEVKSWEKKVWWASTCVFTALLLALILWNICAVNYFP